MEPNGMIHEELLESNLGLDADGKHEGYELDVGHGARSQGGEFNHHGIEQSVDGKDASGRNGSPDLFPAELETRAEEGAGLEGEGGQSEAHECSNMLIACAPSEGDAGVLMPNVGEENSVMDTAELCYDAVVLPTLPADGSHEAQGAPVDYAETYMSSPGEREGVLISTVPPLPPTFFQTTHMDVTGSASWEELHLTHAESGYGTGPSSAEVASLGSGNSTERAFVDSSCEEPLKAGGLEIGKEHTLSSGPSLQDMGTTNAENPLCSSGVSDAKNEDWSLPTREDGSHGGGGMLLSGPRDRKEKGPLRELSLRRVLSDPVTGTFMDDAMVAMCGHSFGSGGLQRVLETRSCLSCGASVPPKTLVPNFALRAAVLAYKHEDHVWQQSSVKGTKRRREQFEMHEGSEPKGASSDPAGSAENTYSDSRSKGGVQFPFVVGDRVIIKGNKRTPERFFGMEAVITSQCLNGWYALQYLKSFRQGRMGKLKVNKKNEKFEKHKMLLSFPPHLIYFMVLQAKMFEVGFPRFKVLFSFAAIYSVFCCRERNHCESDSWKKRTDCGSSVESRYLVRTLDTGESVRLQYRSMQKLGETDSPLATEPRLSTEQQVDSACGPLSIVNPDGYPTGAEPASEKDPESQPLASEQQHESITAVNCSIAVESVKVQLSEGGCSGTLDQSLVAADDESFPTLNGGNPTTFSKEGSRNTSTLEVGDGLSEPVNGTDKAAIRETADQEVLDAVSKKSSADLPLSLDAVRVEEPDEDQSLCAGLNHDVGVSSVEVGTSMRSPEAPPSVKDGEGIPNIESTGGDGLRANAEGGKFPEVVNNQTNGTETLRTRSKRTAWHFKSSAASGGFLQDSDPYRKVYTSGSRRRIAKEESVVTVIPDHLPTDSKSLLRGANSNNNGKGSEKTPAKGSNVGSSGTGKQVRDLKLKSANEILQIMRKDMLKLEKQIPRNYLLRSWRVRRVRWQKQVHASQTVLELGAQVRDFRYSLLLTSAGGMSDEEWDMRITQIMESGDVELLVALWGRLYSDVHKWLESRPLALPPAKDVHLRKLLTAEDRSLSHTQDRDGGGGGMSSVHVATAATLAAVDAAAAGDQHDIDSSIKALLSSTMKVLQQQSRSELSAVREALEWEKRHITAKLQHLEQRFANLYGTSELSGLEDDNLAADPVTETLVIRASPPTAQCTSASTDRTAMSRAFGSAPALDSRHSYETEEDESDTPLPTQQEADGEATDMSDSD